MDSKLIDAVLELDAAGPKGFEGLVADLLGELTGRRFQLAKAGFQAGRDISSRYTNANVIAVECKRYKQTTELNERELLGELVQVKSSMPDLDLWVLVTSRNVPSQLGNALHLQARREHIEFLSISANDGEPSSLEVLCAQSPEIVMAYVNSKVSDEEKEGLEKLLKGISNQPEFVTKTNDLKDKLHSPLIGYDNWRSAQNQWFGECLASETESRAHFSQPLNIREPNTILIPRDSAWEQLDTWFSTWKEAHKMFVMQGEEGDGKTWAVASWLNRNIQTQEDFPAVIFLSSHRVDNNEPLTLLARVIYRRLSTLQTEDWEQRLSRWTTESPGDIPRLLLVLDGINERHKNTWWRGLIDRLNGSPWRDAIAVLITCRTAYWQRYFKNLRYLQPITYILPSYNNEELDMALAYHNLSRSDIPNELLSLVRKPRYFDLMVKHRERIAQSGDVTVARLIYEDWRDRLQRKGLELDNEAFETLLRDLASVYLSGQNSVKEREVDALLPSYYEDKRAIMEELRTGGILQLEHGHLRVDERRLVHGFGLLLVDQIRKAIITNECNWSEVIAKWLEPQAEMGIKAQICEFAAMHALSQPELPQKAKIALLNTWVSSQNLSETAVENFTAYYPIDPLCYLGLAEVVWSDANDNPWAQEQLMRTLRHWCNHSELTTQLRTAFEQWLGFVHLYGALSQQVETEKDAERLRQKLCDRINLDLKIGPFTFADRPLTATKDNGLLRLGRAALAIISHVPRKPFVRAIATGCVAEAIMNNPQKYDLFKWVMITASQSVWDEVKQEVEQMLETDHVVTRQAAYRLLSFEGSEKAYELRQTFPDNLFPPRPLYELYKKDPCTSGFMWRAEECETCFQREDLSPRSIARSSKHQCVNPNISAPDNLGVRLEALVENISLHAIWSTRGPTGDDLAFDEYEPCLCAYAPQAIADLVRGIVRQADQREKLSLQSIAWRLKEHYLIFEAEEMSSIYRAWKRLHEDILNCDMAKKNAERFLFRVVLKGLDACKQFKYLLARPDDASDLVAYEWSFLPMQDWGVIWNELSFSQNVKRIQRSLWFLSIHPRAIPRDCISEKLAPFLKHGDSLVRSSVLKIAYFTQDEKIINACLEGRWAWSESFCDRENHWGSLLLCEHGDTLGYLELRCRVYPTYLGYAVKCRGMQDDEVAQYAKDIHYLWSRIGTETPSLPVDFPSTDIKVSKDITECTQLELSATLRSRSITFMSRDFMWGGISGDGVANAFQSQEAHQRELQNLIEVGKQAIEEQRKAGNSWSAQHFHPDALEVVLEKKPELVSEWVNFALADKSEAIRRILLARSFYYALCTTLLKYKPSMGISLYWRLQEVDGGIIARDAQSQIELLDYALFNAPDVTVTQEAWKRKLEQCTTDQEIMQVAIIAQHGNGERWLQSYIDNRVRSSIPLERSRAFTCLGFVEAEKIFETLTELRETQPETWSKRLLETSLHRWQTNAWAKHWFRRFLYVSNDVESWAAFRLFLQCVDNRFWLWKQIIQYEIENDDVQTEKRLGFLKENLGTIKDRIQKNEKDLKKHLFGQKIQLNQVWPWM